MRAVADSIRAEPHFTQPLPMNQPINYSFTSHVFIGGFLPTLDLGQEKERNGKSSNDELQFLIVKWRVEIAKGKNGKRT